ncbi:MAG: methionyl-tRNA formyltransferase [Opitutaceae bacterium]|nr:methionyl-tRNA formyltransferase [Opitutaceae bacterium]
MARRSWLNSAVPALKLVFLGSDPIALPLLDWLTGEGARFAQVAAVFTQPDRPVGRGQKITPNAIKQWALARAIPVHQPEKLRAEALQTLVALAADVSLVMAYGHILRQEFIDTPRLGTLNLHASLLPKYRGASPIQTAVAAGECETGVSLMRIVRELDAGPVADLERVPIERTDTALEIEAKLAAACVPLLARSLPLLAEGKLEFQAQNQPEATFCRRLVKTDGGLDFSAPASELAARINGLFPWPACSGTVEGQTIKFGMADAIEGAGEPGMVLGCDADGLRIGTGLGMLRIRRLQRPGGKMLPAGEFLRGAGIPPGSRFVSFPMPPLVSRAPFRA